VRTRFFGRRDRVPGDLQQKMAGLEAETAHLDRLALWIAFDYGGRAELVGAARRLAEEGVRPRTSRGRVRIAPLCARASRPRPRDPHVRRAADLELLLLTTNAAERALLEARLY
jgi:undecaprenyl pyrophosphate synthase